MSEFYSQEGCETVVGECIWLWIFLFHFDPHIYNSDLFISKIIIHLITENFPR
jgi:hypothetical protein